MDMRKICFEVSESEDGDGYMYVVFTDHGDEFVMVASGSGNSIAEVFSIIQNVTERTL